MLIVFDILHNIISKRKYSFIFLVYKVQNKIETRPYLNE